MLDPIQQRVLGVLIEKELAVPDSYPLTEASLLAGCNQKSNRDPEMSLESHDIHEALLALRESGWVTRIDGSSRSAKYRHNVETMLGVVLADAEQAADAMFVGLDETARRAAEAGARVLVVGLALLALIVWAPGGLLGTLRARKLSWLP